MQFINCKILTCPEGTLSFHFFFKLALPAEPPKLQFTALSPGGNPAILLLRLEPEFVILLVMMILGILQWWYRRSYSGV